MFNEKLLQKHVVHVSRHWEHPNIEVKVYVDGIAVEISLEDFCKALAAEVPHPIVTLTRGKLERDILAAMDVVLEKAKESTIHV